MTSSISVAAASVLLLCLISSGAFATSVYFREQSSLKRLSTWNFDLMLHLLETNFPNLDGSSGISSLQLLTPRVTVTYIAPASQPTFDTKENRLSYSYPGRAMSFKLSFYWVLTFLVLPVSGTAEAEFTVEDIKYGLTFSGKNVQPSISAKWTVNSVTVENNLVASLLGIANTLKDTLNERWNQVAISHFNSVILPLVADYFKVRFPQEYNMVISYFDSEHTLVHPYNLSSFTVGEADLLYSYSAAASIPAASKSASDEPFAMQYHLGNDEVLRTVRELFEKLYPTIALDSSSIPADCSFQLNARQFAQVIPDFFMQFGNVNLKAQVVLASTKNAEIAAVGHKQIRVKGIHFNVTFMYGETKLVTGVLCISGLFSPVVAIAAGERTALLKLSIDAMGVKVKDVQKFGYFSVVKVGLQSYVQSALDNWVAESFKQQVLGNGIYLELDSVLDPTKSYAEVVDTGVKAWIYSATN